MRAASIDYRLTEPMLYLRWCGAALIMLCALFCGREYSAYAERRICEGAGLLALLLHIEKMIDSYLAPGGELLVGFSDEWLEKCGFLGKMREGGVAAFPTAADSLAVGESIKKRLSDYFSGFGKGYKESELARLRECISDCKKMLSEEREELEKSVKVTRALLLGGAVGIAILII